MKLTDICQEFRALAQQAFLDSACACLAAQRQVNTLREFLHFAGFCSLGSSAQHHIGTDTMRSAARRPIAINAEEEDIALDENATHGTRLVRQQGKARV